MHSFLEKIRKKRRKPENSINICQSSAQNGHSSSSSLQSPVNTTPDFTTCRLKLVDEPSKQTRCDGPCSSSTRSLQDLSFFEHSEFDHAIKRKIYLPKTLRETLDEPTALGHFLLFMESQNLRHLVKFWLDAETFKISTLAVFQRITQRENDDIETLTTYGGALIKMIEQDAVAIFSKYLSKEAIHSIGITDQLRNKIIDRICLENGKLDAECFEPAQDFILCIMQNRYYPSFLKSVHYCKLLLEIVNQRYLRITDILYDETALFHFIEFMEQNGNLNLVEFWLGAKNFHEKFSLIDIESSNDTHSSLNHAQVDAMILYKKYLAIEAPNRLNFMTDELRSLMENKICKQGGPGIDCFQALSLLVLQILEKDFLPIFLDSKLFSKFKQELINTIDNDLELPVVNRRNMKPTTDGSDCSSHNTSVSFKPENLNANSLNRKRTSSVSSKSIDSSQNVSLIDSRMFDDDPDSLWKQDRLKLALGYIDESGNYITAVERPSELSKVKNAQKVKDKMKKVVFGDLSHKEMLAEQVAALIIQDVQNMTSSTGVVNTNF